MNSNFLDAFYKTIGHEGGYVNDPLDRGGETYCGIARKFWANWEGWEIIDAVKKYHKTEINMRLASNEGLNNMVEDFYRKNYWDINSCSEFSQEIANELFDTAVNQGYRQAAQYFQKSLNKLNRNQKDYKDLFVDGDLGDNTIKAYKAYMQTSRFSTRNILKLNQWLLSLMNYYQLDKYVKITDHELAQERFIPGWLNRV